MVESGCWLRYSSTRLLVSYLSKLLYQGMPEGVGVCDFATVEPSQFQFYIIATSCIPH